MSGRILTVQELLDALWNAMNSPVGKRDPLQALYQEVFTSNHRAETAITSPAPVATHTGVTGRPCSCLLMGQKPITPGCPTHDPAAALAAPAEQPQPPSTTAPNPSQGKGELLPCPFCAETLHQLHGFPWEGRWSGHRRGCFLDQGIRRDTFMSDEISAWNTRPTRNHT